MNLCVKHENKSGTYFYCTGKSRMERRKVCDFSQKEHSAECLYWNGTSTNGKHDCLNVSANNACEQETK